jgi:hypothetical protein
MQLRLSVMFALFGAYWAPLGPSKGLVGFHPGHMADRWARRQGPKTQPICGLDWAGLWALRRSTVGRIKADHGFSFPLVCLVLGAARDRLASRLVGSISKLQL